MVIGFAGAEGTVRPLANREITTELILVLLGYAALGTVMEAIEMPV